MPNNPLDLLVREPEMGKVDRRKCERFLCDWAATVEGLNADGLPLAEESVVIDLSAQGACVSLNAHVQVGASMRISIKLPTFLSMWMQYDARVVRVEREGLRPRVALKFEQLRPRFLKRDGSP